MNIISAIETNWCKRVSWNKPSGAPSGKVGNGSGMETGNGNIKVAGLLAALIDLCVVAGLLFVCIRSSPSLQFT